MERLNTEELNQLLSAGESRYVEYKAYQDINDDDEVLSQLAAFANRAGGTLLYGVLDDGVIEGATIDADSQVEKISNLVQNRTSPIIEFLPLFYHGPNGDVLALRVLKRRGIPCAVIRRKFHEIQSRRYFVRTSHGVRMMDDKTLEWLFLHQDDPIISESFQACIQYYRDDISLRSGIYHPSLMQWGLIPIFQTLSEKQLEILKSDEAENMQRFLVEIMPYAIINHLSQIYMASWKVKVRRVGGRVNWSPVPSDSEQLDLSQLTLPDTSTMLKSMAFSVPSAQFRNRICLPPGTSLSVDIDKPAPTLVNSIINLNKAGTFNILIRIRPAIWSVGAAPGHPLGAAFGGFIRGDEQLEIQEKFAHVSLDIDFTATFEFPDEPCDEIQEYFDWAQQLVMEIRTQWDWDQLVGSLPPGILYSIERDVKEILDNIRHKIKKRGRLS